MVSVMQCKDIPEEPILRFLEGLGREWANRFGREYDNSVLHAMPPDTPQKVATAKMGQMIRKGLVEGCTCGRCRGDYYLSDKGRAELAKFANNPNGAF